MKLSIRNSFSGKVVEISRGQVLAKVKVDIGGGQAITSSITLEAVDDLALKVGDQVTAFVKSSDVFIGK